jgi:hypothetical protein
MILKINIYYFSKLIDASNAGAVCMRLGRNSMYFTSRNSICPSDGSLWSPAKICLDNTHY